MLNSPILVYMKDLSKHWLAKYADRISIPTPKRKVKIIRKSLLVILGILIILSLTTNPGTTTNTLSYYTSFDKAQNTASRFLGGEGIDETSFSPDEAYSYNYGVAIRGQATFAELSAGCVAETEWLLPLKEGKPIVPTRQYDSEKSVIDEFRYGYPRLPDESDYNYANRLLDIQMKKVDSKSNINWYSYPPVRGNYAINDWAGSRIIKTDDKPMRFEEGLRLLNQGHYVIWYHPIQLDESMYEFSELKDYVLQNVLKESQDSPKLYLVPLVGSNLDEYPRKIYLTRLNYTQSCISFNNETIDKFYSF